VTQVIDVRAADSFGDIGSADLSDSATQANSARSKEDQQGQTASTTRMSDLTQSLGPLDAETEAGAKGLLFFLGA